MVDINAKMGDSVKEHGLVITNQRGNYNSAKRKSNLAVIKKSFK